MSLETIHDQETQRASTFLSELKDFLARTNFARALKAIIKHVEKEIKDELLAKPKKHGIKPTDAEVGYTELLQSSPIYHEKLRKDLFQKVRNAFAKALELLVTTFQHKFTQKLGLPYESIDDYAFHRIKDVATHLIQNPQHNNDHISSIYETKIEDVTAVEDMLYSGTMHGSNNTLIILTRLKYWQEANTAQGKKLNLLALQRQVLFDHNYDGAFGSISHGFHPDKVKDLIAKLRACMKVVTTNPGICSREVVGYAKDFIKVDHNLVQEAAAQYSDANSEAETQSIVDALVERMPDFSTDHIHRVVSGQNTTWTDEL